MKKEPTKVIETNNWMIRNFPKDLKAQYMGYAKIAGQNWKIILGEMMKDYIGKVKQAVK